MSDAVHDYCSSEYFLLLDSAQKEHAESLLSYWSEQVGEAPSIENIEAALKMTARLDLPVDVRKAFPGLLKEFLKYLSTTGKFPDAGNCEQFVCLLEQKYVDSFREDGSVRGETFRKEYADVGRNDPCPCGSGKKFKKCCLNR